MKKICIYAILMVLSLKLSAQGLNEIWVKSFTKLKDDPTALENKVLTADGRPCALIKVQTLLDDLEFDANMEIPKVEKQEKGYWVFVSPEESRLQILKEDFLPFEYHIDTQYVVESYQVYKMDLSSNASYPVVLGKSPRTALLSMDGEEIPGNHETDTVEDISLGRHVISMKKEGYKSFTDTILVTESSRSFSFEMERLGKFCINTSPGKAKIFINGTRKGYSSDCFYKPSGDYHIRLEKNNYLPYDTTIQITSRSDQLYHFNLQYNLGTIQVEANVNDPEIYLNGKKVYSKTKEVQVKKHKVTVKKEGYYEQNKWVMPERNTTKLVHFKLKPKIGDLTLNIKTEDTQVELYRDNQLIREWSGPRTLHDLQVGTYRVKISKEYFVDYNQYIDVQENTNTYKEINLREYDNKKAGAIIWSLFVPGAGQFYSTGQNGRGTFYILSGLAAGGAFVYYNYQIGELNRDYTTAGENYESAESLTNIAVYRREMEEVESEINQMEEYRQFSLYAAAGVYALGFLDALLFGGKKVPPDDIITSSLNTNNRVKMGLKPVYGGMGVSVSLQF